MSTVVSFSRYGDPDVLAVSQAEVPVPALGQVLVRVRAVSVNAVDVKIRSGMMDGIMPVEFPVIPGWDVAGDAGSSSLEHPGSPSAAAIAAALKTAVRRRGIQRPSVRRTHRLDQRHRRVVRQLPAALIDEPEVFGCRGQVRARRGDGRRGGTGAGGGDVADVERQRQAALGSGLLQFVVGKAGRNRDAALDEVALVGERDAGVLQRVEDVGQLACSGQIRARDDRVERQRSAEHHRLNLRRRTGNRCNTGHTCGRGTDRGNCRDACG